MADIVSSDHVRARGDLVEIRNARDETVLVPRVSPIFTERPGEVRWTGLPLGASNDEVYQGLLGLTAEECEGLRTRGVI